MFILLQPGTWQGRVISSEGPLPYCAEFTPQVINAIYNTQSPEEIQGFVLYIGCVFKKSPI
jgi:hypothetical protein